MNLFNLRDSIKSQEDLKRVRELLKKNNSKYLI
jgi:hypothetical protein